MKTRYDPEVDALYVRFAEAKIVESEEVRPGVVLDFDAPRAHRRYGDSRRLGAFGERR